MKKIILILSILFIFFSTTTCRTKRILKTQSKEVEKTEVKEVQKTEQIEIKKDSEVKSEEVKKTENKTEEKQQVEITGKTDENNPLSFYNIVNGDTIDLFKVTGNADVIFKSYKSNSNSSLNSNTSNNSQKESENRKSNSTFLEKATEVAKSVENKSVEVVKKNVTFGTYLTFLLWGLLAIGILVGVFYLRKTTWWSKILNIFK